MAVGGGWWWLVAVGGGWWRDAMAAISMRGVRQAPRTQMGAPRPRSTVEPTHKGRIEWMKALLFVVMAVSSFSTISFAVRARWMARKAADFGQMDKVSLECAFRARACDSTLTVSTSSSSLLSVSVRPVDVSRLADK